MVGMAPEALTNPESTNVLTYLQMYLSWFSTMMCGFLALIWVGFRSDAFAAVLWYITGKPCAITTIQSQYFDTVTVICLLGGWLSYCPLIVPNSCPDNVNFCVRFHRHHLYFVTSDAIDRRRFKKLHEYL